MPYKEGFVMNMFLREMKAHQKSLIFWCIGVILMVTTGMSKYTSMSGSRDTMNELMADMPKSLQAIMGTGVFDLSKASGYYGVLFLYLVLMATIHSVLLGANIISKEERDKTSEFLYVKPVSRRKIISSKLAAALSNIVVINMITFISSILILAKYSNGEEGLIGDVGILMVGMFLLQLLFMVIGTGFAAVMRNPKRASSIATGTLLVTFILSIAIDLNEKLDVLKYFSPFKYFEAKNLMYGGGLEGVFVILTVVLITILLIVTYLFFSKRDLKI
jgi:ABC-2 type transport system permease protein